ncbi:MAG: DUF4377 domain-containing protein [Flavobacteriales bacterium]|jgi:heat shock protein HslJ
MKLIFALISILVLAGCVAKIRNPHSEPKQSLAPDEKIIWVYSFTESCMGIGPMRCLQIQENDTVSENSWTNLHDGIEGFTFEPGTRKKLIIKQIQLKANEVPADASSIKRILVKVIDSVALPNEQLDGKWMPSKILGIPSNDLNSFGGFIEILGNQLSGTDGCNQINGSINKQSVATFKMGGIVQTKRMCAPEIMKYSDLFTKNLSQAYDYSITDNVLSLRNTEGITLAEFMRAL